MSKHVLGALEPAGVFHFFEEMCAIPHGSGNTKAISDYCVAFAKARGLRYVQDESNNIVIYQEGTPGYEDHPTVILQGHLDMVCAKEADCPLNMERDGLDLVVDGDFVRAKGTTLGGDDGIAVAYALAILDDKTIHHPPIEAVFTVDEEIGLLGAAALDCSVLQGRRLLNCDSEAEGILTVGCAGGARCDMVLPVTVGHDCGYCFTVKFSGYTGGHSGAEIHQNRGNTLKLIGEALRAVLNCCEAQLMSLTGGKQDNAIPTEASATLLIPSEERENAFEALDRWWKEEGDRYGTTDPNGCMMLSKGGDVCADAVSVEDTRRCADLLCALPNGVQAMSKDIPGLVETSLNLGILRLETDALHATSSVRSSVKRDLAALIDNLRRLTEDRGGSFSTRGEYPPWEYRKDSPLRDTMAAIFREQYGKEPVVEAIHAGLECGLFSDRLPGLDCVSFGPDIIDIHTPREHLSIASTQRTWKFLLAVLAAL